VLEQHVRKVVVEAADTEELGLAVGRLAEVAGSMLVRVAWRPS